MAWMSIFVHARSCSENSGVYMPIMCMETTTWYIVRGRRLHGIYVGTIILDCVIIGYTPVISVSISVSCSEYACWERIQEWGQDTVIGTEITGVWSYYPYL